MLLFSSATKCLYNLWFINQIRRGDIVKLFSLDFLKKKKEGPGSDDLDIPPAPPMKRDIQTLQEVIEEHEEVDLVPEIKHKESKVEKVRPIFISLERFKKINEETKSMKSILNENADVLARISEFKLEEEREFNKWESAIKSIQKNLVYVDQKLFKTER